MFGLEDRYNPPARFSDALDQLHTLVAGELGPDNFGPPDYLPGLKAVLLSMDYDPVFTEQGRRIAWGQIYTGLFARAHAYKSMRENPGFEQTAIRAPLIITGIPRTGTTALHKMLAVDPQFQGLQGWLLGAPQPRPPRAEWESNPLFQNAVERLAARHAATPGSRAAHDMAAEEVDECLGVLGQSFMSNLWASICSSASYDLWLQTQTERPAYAHYHRVLQLIGSNEPQKPWLLKNPGHIANLGLLFETFPDARVVHTHRDPAKAIPSLCALLIRHHPIMEEGRADLRARLLGQRETEKWAKAIRDAAPVRAAHQDQVLDVVHADFHRDPLGIIDRIYAFAGLELKPAVREAMASRAEARPELQHGVHQYRLEDFGLTAAGVRGRFGDYVERFSLA